MSSPTESTPDSSFSDVMFTTAVVIVCLMALAISIHVLRGRRFHGRPVTVNIERTIFASARGLALIPGR
jgi:hypothetical protein